MDSFIVFISSGFVFVGLYLLSLLLCTFIIKFLYKIIQVRCPINEGIYTFTEKTKEYSCYFLRSFIIRYIKWKILKSPFPWLLAPIFNYIGNCKFGKDVTIEDLYMAKEFVEVGDGVHLGNIIIANHYWDKSLTVKGIKIEDNTVVSDGTCIGPGVNIGKNSTILPLSITTKFNQLIQNGFYKGAPISPIDRTGLTNHYNLDLNQFREIIIKNNTEGMKKIE